MYLLGATIANLFFLGIIIYCLFRPSEKSIISAGIAIAGYSNAIDQYWGRVVLTGGEEYTLLTSLDIIFSIFVFTNIFYKKIEPKILIASLSLLSIILINYVSNIDKIKDQYIYFVYTWNYIRVIIFFLAFHILMGKKYFQNDKKDGNAIFLMTFFVFFTLCIFMLATSGNNRLNLPHLNQNILANYISLLALCGIWISATKTKKEKYAFIGISALIVAMTASRTGLAIMIILLSLNSIQNDKPKNTAITLTLILISSVLIFTFNDRLNEALLNFENLSNIDTIRSRLSIWTANIEYLNDRLIWGVGAGQQYIDRDYPRMLGSELGYKYVFVTAHNDFLQATVHLGLTFSVPFFLAIFSILKKSGIWFQLIIALQFIVNSNIETPRYGMLLGICLAISFKYGNTKFGKLSRHENQETINTRNQRNTCQPWRLRDIR